MTRPQLAAVALFLALAVSCTRIAERTSPIEPPDAPRQVVPGAGVSWAIASPLRPMQGRVIDGAGGAFGNDAMLIYVDHSSWAALPDPGQLPGVELARETISIGGRSATLITHNVQGEDRPKRLVLHVPETGVGYDEAHPMQLIITAYCLDERGRNEARRLFATVQVSETG